MTLAVALAAIVPLATLTPTRIQAEPAKAVEKEGATKDAAAESNASQALVAGATSGTGTSGTEKGDGASGSQKADAAKLQMLVRVIAAETGEPVVKADLRIRARAPGKQLPALKQRFALKTNAQGEALIEFPAGAQLQSFTLDTKAAGLVPQHVRWSGEHRAIEFPREKVIRLQPAMTIGGVVQDAAGKPIAGAEVEITYPATESDMKNYYYHLERALKTDKEGRWTSNNIPHDMTNMGIRVKHANFIEDEIAALANRNNLLEKRDVHTLRGGPQLNGQVVDEQGNPLAARRYFLAQRPMIRTSARRRAMRRGASN